MHPVPLQRKLYDVASKIIASWCLGKGTRHWVIEHVLQMKKKVGICMGYTLLELGIQLDTVITVFGIHFISTTGADTCHVPL